VGFEPKISAGERPQTNALDRAANGTDCIEISTVLINGQPVYTGFWWGNRKERDHLGDPRVNGRKIIRRIFRKWDVGVWTGSSWLRIGQVAGACECGNEPSGYIKCGEFLD